MTGFSLGGTATWRYTRIDPDISANIVESLNEDGSEAKMTVFDNATHIQVPELDIQDFALY